MEGLRAKIQTDDWSSVRACQIIRKR
jgi:hypothetical protein